MAGATLHVLSAYPGGPCQHTGLQAREGEAPPLLSLVQTKSNHGPHEREGKASPPSSRWHLLPRGLHVSHHNLCVRCDHPIAQLGKWQLSEAQTPGPCESAVLGWRPDPGARAQLSPPAAPPASSPCPVLLRSSLCTSRDQEHGGKTVPGKADAVGSW